MIYEAILIFVIGMSLGSFLNVVIYRLDDLESLVKERSRCPKCKKILYWKDLIPFLSFVLLRGRCRYCDERISWQYPLVELLTGFLLLSFYLFFGFSFPFFYYSLLFLPLIVVFVHDLKTQEIPMELVWPTLALAFLGSFLISDLGALSSVYGALTCAAIPTLLSVASREKWMGYGDIGVALLLGAMVGFPNSIFLIVSSFILGSIVGLLMIAFQRTTIKNTLPFAPFLISASILTIFWGQIVIDWYMGYFIV